MRGFIIFVCGALVGLLLETERLDSRNPGVFALNHININVDDIDEALAFYTQTMGFENVFSLANEEGQVGIIYLKVGDDTFLTLNTAGGALPRGVTHMGIQVDDLESARSIYRARGARLSETFTGRNQEARAFISGPQGILIELSEYPPDSALGKVLAGG